MIRGNKRKKATHTTAVRDGGRLFHLTAIDGTHLREECDEATLGPKTGAALEELGHRRNLFLRCSGMHTEPVWWVIKSICKGETSGPGLSYVAPALYEGVPQFLDSIKEGMSELAVYSSLYMGLVSGLAFSDARPMDTGISGTLILHGMYSSVFLHSGVVFLAIFHRIGSIGHLRDSDKLLYLWRARYLPLLATSLFVVGTASAIATLMFGVTEHMFKGVGCVPDQPRMEWFKWFNEFAELYGNRPAKGQGVVFPEGEALLNPWMQRAAELNITYDPSQTPPHVSGNPVDAEHVQVKMYEEFMKDYFDLAVGCSMYSTYQITSLVGIYSMFFATVLCWTLFWIVPTRNMFNYWSSDRSMPSVTQPHVRAVLSVIGAFSFYAFGPLASAKVDDPYDMTEAWEEFTFRARVGKALASKDKDADGFVDVDEHHWRSLSSRDLDVSPDLDDEETPVAAAADSTAVDQQGIELTSIAATPLEKHAELLAQAGFDVEAMRKLSEQTLFMALQATGIAPGECCKIILAVATDPTDAGSGSGS